MKHLPGESFQKFQQVQQEPKTSYACYYHLIQRILKNMYYRPKSSEASTKHLTKVIIKANSKDLGQRLMLARNGTLSLKKGLQNFHPSPYSIPFLIFLPKNKSFYNFWKKGQHLIVQRNIGLEYALIMIKYYPHIHLNLHNVRDPDKTLRKSKDTSPLSQF